MTTAKMGRPSQRLVTTLSILSEAVSLPAFFFFVACLDDGCYVEESLVCDDALGIVVQLFLGGLDVRVDVLHDLGLIASFAEHLVVVLEDLDGVPALLLLGSSCRTASSM